MANRNWNLDNSQMARVEGWDVFNLNSAEPSIQRIDDDEEFESDEEAISFVKEMASQKSPLHQKALLIVGL